MPVIKWEAKKPELRELIIKELAEKEKSWTELWHELKHKIKSKTTLSLYLKTLEDEGHLCRREERGRRRRALYSLLTTEYVQKILKGVGKQLMIPEISDLRELNEEEFLRFVDCLISFNLLDVFRNRMNILEEKKRGGKAGTLKILEDLREIHLGRFRENVSEFERFLNEMIMAKRFNRNKILKFLKRKSNKVMGEYLVLMRDIEKRKMKRET